MNMTKIITNFIIFQLYEDYRKENGRQIAKKSKTFPNYIKITKLTKFVVEHASKLNDM